MQYCPWRDLTSREDVAFGVTRLPWGRGWWIRAERAIVLDDRLTQAERRSVLAHELVHAELDDENCAAHAPRIARRRERQADRVAARRLIPLEQLAEALLWATDEHELADELSVAVDTVRTRLDDLGSVEVAYIESRLWAEERGS